MNILPLHLLAVGRGDGLHPKLLELLEAHAARAVQPHVEELALHRGDTHMQSGPHPARPAHAPLPENVVLIAARPAPSELPGRSKAVPSTNR